MLPVIPINEIECTHSLHDGAYSDALAGEWIPYSLPVVVKASHDFSEDEIYSEYARNAVKKEAMLLMTMKHPNIIRMQGVIDEAIPQKKENGEVILKPVYGLVLEYIPWDLSVLLFNGVPISPLSIAFDIASALDYLHHHKNIIHLDIKTENILIDEKGKAKLCDFGIAVELKANEMGVTKKFYSVLNRHIDPHSIAAEWYSRKTDMYAFAVALWEMTNRRLFLANFKDPRKLYKAAKEGVREKISESCHPVIASIIQEGWHHVPDNRPTVKSCLMRLKHALLFSTPQGKKVLEKRRALCNTIK